MQIYFHSRLCSYLSRVPILVEGTVETEARGLSNLVVFCIITYVKKTHPL